MLQKSRVLQIQGAKGEVSYCEPLATQEMQRHRLSRWVNNTMIRAQVIDFIIGRIFLIDPRESQTLAVIIFSYPHRAVYATLG
jgi:hypothetical protein